ncbi:hypothetical protein DAKH74_055210 [Maudiozyma humilis]|uniref:Mitochondrial import inner membrane translocase subunit TIM22 n=1 Tax=Maudiozyma humilis TaxID=51915 RepID=A0AAV5S4W0_MAUHU|nr:hypothetical protein DAKH74_055210 [Kazachstania humilis]
MGFNGFGLEHTIAPDSSKSWRELTPAEQSERGATMMINFMTSCPGKTAISGVTGFSLGGVFGLFMASMAYDTPLHSPLSAASGVAKIAEVPFTQQIKLQFADMGKRSYSSAKNFGYMGLIYAGTECVVESVRAKSDIYNGLWAGCLTGGGLAYKNGPQAALMGCAGFAAFSLAIDTYMNSENGKPGANDFNE